MKKLLVSYSNCQGSGALFFLKRTHLAEEYEMRQWNNWQCMLDEVDPQAMLKDATQADVFLYQPTDRFESRAGFNVPSTDEIKSLLVPDGCQCISFAYAYNDGFFPLLKHGDWKTGNRAKELAAISPYRLFAAYNADLTYDCARRFVECLSEMSKREQLCDIKMVPFILNTYRDTRLFLNENHPSSFMFCHLAQQIYIQIKSESPDVTKMLTADENEVNLPMGINPTHQSVVNELGLRYLADERAHEFYRNWFEQYLKEMKP